jgi:hypothetical protein
MRLLLLAVGLAALTAHAQVQLQLEFDRTQQFVVGEKCEVAVRIVNYTGTDLPLGGKPDWLRFSIEEYNRGAVIHTKDTPTIGEFSLKPSTRGTVRFNLEPIFQIDHPGRYLVHATMLDPISGDNVASRVVEFEVINALTLWEQAYFVPSPAQSVPQRRKYSLQQASFSTKAMLYARNSDETGTVTYSILQLGPLLGFAKPDQMIDRGTRLHVLHRVGSQEYLYHVFNTDGSLETRRLYSMAGQSTPALRVNDEGEVTVIGGTRRKSTADYQAGEKPAALPAANDKNSKLPE